MWNGSLANMNTDILNRPINNVELDNTLWNDKCDYVELDGTDNLNPNNYNLLILQLNIRSLLEHQSDLNTLLTELSSRNSNIDVILLCETFLSKNTVGMVNIPGYNHVCNYRQERKGGGVSILIKHGIPYKRRMDLDEFIEGETESIFIEMTSKCGKSIIVGSIYRPPNTKINQFQDRLVEIVKKAKLTKKSTPPELVLGMDHNIDLLKCKEHAQTQQFTNSMNELNLFPMITRPSRITHHSAALIDNIYISEQLHRSFDSMLLINDISDHLPVITLLKQTKVLCKEPLQFTSRCPNERKLKEVNQHLMRTDWIGILDRGTCNEKFDKFCSTVKLALDREAPVKTVRISPN